MNEINQPSDATFFDQLASMLGDSAIISSDRVGERAVSYWDSSPMTAAAILRPKTTAEVSEALRLCHEYGKSVITHGGRTGCVQGTKSGKDDIVISLERMNEIEEIDLVSHTLVVQAGAVLEQVQAAVRDQGLLLPLDLGARGSCTIGGNLATNAGGINVIRYGMARAMVLGLEVVLPDGTILSSMNKMLKNNAGFDLKQLYIGTEGTLGIITRAVLKLEPLPITQNTALAAIKSFEDVPKLLNHLKGTVGASLSAFEAMWGDYLRAVTQPGWHKAPMDSQHPFYVLFECEGNDPARDDERFMEVIEAAFDAGYIVDAVIPKSGAERQALWNIRDDFEAILSPKPVFLYDVSLPLQSMEQYVSDVQSALNTSLPNSKVFVLGHVGDGNLHFFVQPHSDAANTHELSDRAIYEPLRSYKGSVSAEHGIGFEKKAWLSQSRSTEEIAVMRHLKNSLDPKKILNSGVVID
jgi:FAD/FMN-containing dehydrogenase